MAQITREGTAPIAAGETGAAADVENEFVKIFAAVNSLDNTNIAAAAAIVGTKLAANTIAEAQVTAGTLTTASMNISAVTKASFGTVSNTNNTALTSSVTMVDVPLVSTITLTPGSTSDIVVLDCQITTKALASSQTTHAFGFNIDDGTGNVEVGYIRGDGDDTRPRTPSIRHAMTATAASITIYKPIYRLLAGTNTNHLWDTTASYNVLFSVTIYPIK